jgi:2-hydroxychromene-2-carboxylate isomerase
MNTTESLQDNMNKTVDFYFDFSSNYSYIGAHRIERLAKRIDLDVHWKPVALGAIFKALGTPPPNFNSPKGRYASHDVVRSAADLGLPYHWPKPFPFSGIQASRMFYVLEQRGRKSEAVIWALAVFDAAFGAGRDCSNPEVLLEIASKLGLDGPALMEAATTDEIKAALRAVTDEAMGRGVFGAPTFFWGEEMFWGDDRIELMGRMIEAAA